MPEFPHRVIKGKLVQRHTAFKRESGTEEATIYVSHYCYLNNNLHRLMSPLSSKELQAIWMAHTMQGCLNFW